MAHMYAKDPPRFAKDPWAWDYTRDKVEGNSGLTYDQWEAKQFMAAAAIYKNVRNKYGDALKERGLSVPRECVDCGGNNVHYEGDYICQNCRDAIENASSYEEAAATVSQPESIEVIREHLYRALGHDKKDAAKGRTKQFGVAGPKPENKVGTPEFEAAGREAMERLTADLPTGETNGSPPVGDDVPTGAVSRNYKNMAEDKLRRSIAELEAGSGEAVSKAQAKGEDPMDHLEHALRIAQERKVAL